MTYDADTLNADFEALAKALKELRTEMDADAHVFMSLEIEAKSFTKEIESSQREFDALTESVMREIDDIVG